MHARAKPLNARRFTREEEEQWMLTIVSSGGAGTTAFRAADSSLGWPV
jgi:hypothetical protein